MNRFFGNLFLVGLMLFTVGGYSFAETVSILRYKVSRDPQMYLSTQREKLVREYRNDTENEISYTIKKKIQEKTEYVDEDILSRTFYQVAGSLRYLNKAKVKATANPTSSELIDSLGRELPFDDTSEKVAQDRIRLIFPEKAIAAGDEWEYIAAPTQVFPAELKTIYKVKSFQKYRNRNCVVIESRTAHKGDHPSHGVSVDIRSRGVIYFDVDNGLILNSVSSTTMETVYVDQNQDLRKLTHVTDAKYRLQD